jgi:hypothetical protein
MRNRGAGDGGKGRAGEALRAFLILVFLFQALLPVSFGQGLQGIPFSLKSPQDIEKWLSGFQYQMSIPDTPQTVEETLGSRAGDCDDLAKVVVQALAGLGIPGDVVVIKRKGVQIMHAICAWKDGDGHYNFFSNKQLVLTQEKSMEGAVKKYFPFTESFSIPSPDQLNASAREGWGGSKRYFMGYRHGAFH